MTTDLEDYKDIVSSSTKGAHLRKKAEIKGNRFI